jgi:hypothetical protein
VRLVDAFMGEAVAARPIRAVRAGVAFGVVDTFLVRAADDAVGHDHGASLMLAKEGLDLLADNRIVAYIDVFGEPAFEHVGRFAFVGDDGDGNLGGQVRSRAIECNRRDRVSDTKFYYVLVVGDALSLTFPTTRKYVWIPT